MKTLVRPITLVEVEFQIKKLKQSAAGLDGVDRKAIRAIDSEEWLGWMNIFLEIRRLPKVLKRFRLKLIPKKQGATLPSEFRPINIGSMVRRLYGDILAQRFEIIETSFQQRGFKPSEGCAINLKIFEDLLKETTSQAKGISYAFLDVRKAFDSVKHTSIIDILAKRGCPRQMVKIVADLYHGNKTSLEDGSIIKLKQGVVQGDPLSPIVFNIVLDYVLRRSLKGRDPVPYGNGTIEYLAFADDLVFLAENPQTLQVKINALSKGMNHIGLSFNVAKCRAAHIMKHRSKNKAWYIGTQASVKSNGTEIPNMSAGETYRYLGVKLYQDGKAAFKIDRSYIKPQDKLAKMSKVHQGKRVCGMHSSEKRHIGNSVKDCERRKSQPGKALQLA